MGKIIKSCSAKQKKIFKIVGITIGAILCLVLAYCIYVIASFHRLEDNLVLEINMPINSLSISSVSAEDTVNEETDSEYTDSEIEGVTVLQAGEEYKIVSYNIGFGAYSPSYTFFMDGGKESWADSKDSASTLVTSAANVCLDMEPDFILIQEIDVDSTRTYHLNELEILQNIFSEYSNTFALNYDSPFLFAPIYEPHGSSYAGMGTFSKYEISSAYRRSLPISDGFSKLLDLDRCYSVNRIPVEGDKELVIINIHLSAYGNSDEVREAQTSMLREELEKEYEAGNYVIVGGDFNHDLKNLDANNISIDGYYIYDRELLPEHFSFTIDLLSNEERENIHDSCRDAGVPYSENCLTVTLDGFIISDNISCVSFECIDLGYAYSDHEPIVMSFVLQ